MVGGPAVIIGPDGAKIREGSKMALCRCGLSNNRPFCSGEHRKHGWNPDGE
ncbi:MAG: CDGSH iron-sulfur domain-containing protein [bacterium]